MYADDIAIYATPRNDQLICAILHQTFDEFARWAARWRLRVHDTDSSCILTRERWRLSFPLEPNGGIPGRGAMSREC